MLNSTRVKFVIAVVVILGIGALVSADFEFPSIGYNQGYQPTQPIPYDHSLHAGKYQIPCLYCHVGANNSYHATVPSLNICMNCHNQIAINKPAIAKIRRAYEKGGSIQWQKVHLLPDFVRFNHRAHVDKGVQCQTCHGPIETMQEVYQYSDLSMGWCVNCHRKPENNAPESCGTCHY